MNGKILYLIFETQRKIGRNDSLSQLHTATVKFKPEEIFKALNSQLLKWCRKLTELINTVSISFQDNSHKLSISSPLINNIATSTSIFMQNSSIIQMCTVLFKTFRLF